MRINVLTLVVYFTFTISAFGQSDLITPEAIKSKEARQNYVDTSDAWKLITMSDDAKTGWLWFYKTAHTTRSGEVEVWIKSIPFDPVAFRKVFKQPTARYVLEFMTFHCGDRRLSAESAMLYGPDDKLLQDLRPAGRRFREPVVPDSVNAGLYDNFCN